MEIGRKKVGTSAKYSTKTVVAHKSWAGTSKPQQERILRLLKAELIDIIKVVPELKSATIKNTEASIELFHGTQTKAFAYLDIYRDDDKDHLVHITGFAPKYLVNFLGEHSDKIKEKFTPCIPELKYCDGKLELNINVMPSGEL